MPVWSWFSVVCLECLVVWSNGQIRVCQIVTGECVKLSHRRKIRLVLHWCDGVAKKQHHVMRD